MATLAMVGSWVAAGSHGLQEGRRRLVRSRAMPPRRNHASRPSSQQAGPVTGLFSRPRQAFAAPDATHRTTHTCDVESHACTDAVHCSHYFLEGQAVNG
jgi:hypothetical protein